MKRTAIAYWLIPAEPERSFFENIIIDLARRYDTPAFEPHMTIHVESNGEDIAEEAIAKAASYCGLIQAKVLRTNHSGEFIKTLFVQFAVSTKLRRVNEIIRNAAQDSSEYQFKPHLSLLYKKVPMPVRRQLANSISLPFSEVYFDSIKAVHCTSPTRNRADVEAWRVVATKPLCG
jgi:2'-5' RNA ligase